MATHRSATLATTVICRERCSTAHAMESEVGVWVYGRAPCPGWRSLSFHPVLRLMPRWPSAACGAGRAPWQGVSAGVPAAEACVQPWALCNTTRALLLLTLPMQRSESWS